MFFWAIRVVKAIWRRINQSGSRSSFARSFLRIRINQELVDCFVGACQPPLLSKYSSKWRGTKAVAFVEANSSQSGGELQQKRAKRRNDVAYHLSCARQVASMKKETRRSRSARKRIESEYCRLKGSFTENPHAGILETVLARSISHYLFSVGGISPSVFLSYFPISSSLPFTSRLFHRVIAFIYSIRLVFVLLWRLP